MRSIMKDAGYAHMGVGSAKGAGKAENAAKPPFPPRCWRPALRCPWRHHQHHFQPRYRSGGCRDRSRLITQSAHPDANIIWGTAFDENLSDEMRVTVVATGFDNKIPEAAQHPEWCHWCRKLDPVRCLQLRRGRCKEHRSPCFGFCRRKARGRGEQRQPLLRRAAGDPEQAQVITNGVISCAEA